MKVSLPFSKLLISSSVLLSSLFGGIAFAEDDDCTYGKLYISDTNSTAVHIFDLNVKSMNNMKEEGTITVAGGPELNLDVSGSGTVVSTVYRGTAGKFFQDGVVNWIDSGVYTEQHGDHFHIENAGPSLISNAAFNCTRPIHYVRHDSKIAIFCDGSYDATPMQINTTVWLLDETKFGWTNSSAIAFTTTLQGSHHGVAIPVDDNHFMHSLATPDRVNRTPQGDAASLPGTFQVIDYQGNILNSLTDTSNKDKSCAGFHGSYAVNDTFVLACDATHGGVLTVQYNSKMGNTYTSRSIPYPTAYINHRTGSFAEDPKSPFVVGNFASNNQSHLLAFKTSDTALTATNVLTLPLRQCAYQFEQTDANMVLVFMPNGVMHAFTVSPVWKEVAKIQVVPNMTACNQATFVSGYGHGFVIHPSSKMLYSVDVSKAEKGNMTVYTSPLPFTPFSAVVAGVPMDTACPLSEPAIVTKSPVMAPVKSPVAPMAAPVVVAPMATPVVVAPTAAAPVVVAPMAATAPVVVAPMAATAPNLRPPTMAPTPPKRKRCGLLGMNVFCPRTACGVLGRLFGMCRK